VWPLFITSIPLAWLGGRLHISEAIFIFILGIALLIAATTMFLQNYFTKSNADLNNSTTHNESSRYMPIIGGGLGFVSGIVGIGGGIFLAPILHLTHWGRAKAIAGVCSAFILINSFAGLLGQISKLQNTQQVSTLFDYWPLFIAVFIGGQLGSVLASTWLNPKWIRLLTALLILLVAIRLLWRSVNQL